MKQILLIIVVVMLVGCGDGGITQCYWCMEDIKKGALICKHCGKSPDSATENGQTNNPSSGGPKNKPQADSWANKSHPDQISIREVETDKQEFRRRLPEYKKFAVIKGTIKLSTYYPIDKVVLPEGLRTG